MLIARADTADRPYSALVADLEAALRRIEHSGAANRLVAADANEREGAVDEPHGRIKRRAKRISRGITLGRNSLAS